MELRKTFPLTRFDSRVISAAVDEVDELRGPLEAKSWADYQAGEGPDGHQMPYIGSSPHFDFLSVQNGNESWDFDDIHEWYGAYDRGAEEAHMRYSTAEVAFSVSTSASQYTTSVTVSAVAAVTIERVMRVFNLAEPDSKVAPPTVPAVPMPPVVVFIGHGRSNDWRDIKDHLKDLHQYSIEAYEVGARSGHSIRDVLGGMLDASSFALLVMTGEDETNTGDPRARQNVVHEAGLFQGRLGFHRAIAVVENGVEVFSNLDGVQQIRYDKGNVQSTFGVILATLRREFGDRR